MKPALVLGLALAANAMGPDSELFGFAVPQGKLGELARKYPGMIMYDEVADDELAAVLASRSRFPSDEDYKKYLFQMRTHMDDAADDELALKYVHLPHLPVPEVTAYDDDELFIGSIRPNINNEDEFCGRSRYHFKTEQEYRKFCAQVIDDYKRTEIRNQRLWKDDELLVRPLVPHITADDELLIRPLVPHIAADDDELFRGYPPVENFKSYEDWLRFTRKMSEETDNELRIRPISVLPMAEPAAFDDELRIRPISVLPTAEPVAFDDELSFMPIPPKTFINRDWIKPARIPTSEALLRDDEADDELAYLGQLINERPFARTFDDDELRAERPSHLKALEMTQMKSELPKMKRKFRPIIDEAPLAQI